ncbi:protein PML-like [Saccostrea cucullata]|uniref:protein PML-like n=1 Tax=Saccostrea cuccullata TaxID=36930 RepID=UPI002ECFCDFC
MEKRLKNQRLRQSLFTSKRRRLELKSLRAMKNSTQSVLEGDTYQSKIGIEEDLDLEDIDLTPVSFPKDGSEIIFDLETTGLARTSDIIQIAAASGDEEFSIYMTPTTEISNGASEATGLTYVGGVLKHRGQAVSCVTPQEGLSQFLNFIKKFSKPILVGHNIQSFDLPVLINQLSRYNLYTDFQKTVFGFIDTLKVAKRTWKRPEVENYKQETLVRTFLDLKYDAHNALADVQSLQRLYKKMMANCLLSSDLFTLNYYACKQSLDPLVKDKVISSQTMKKLLQCSLSLSKLRSIHKRDTFNGIRNVFVEQCEGSKVPRISKSKAVIDKLITYLNT